MQADYAILGDSITFHIIKTLIGIENNTSSWKKIKKFNSSMHALHVLNSSRVIKACFACVQMLNPDVLRNTGLLTSFVASF